MALIARISRLFQADIHAVLDKIEDPEQLLKQSIREMEESVANEERQIRSWACEQQQLANKHDQQTELLIELDDKLTLCFKTNNDDLARSVIKQKLETQQTINLLAEKKLALKEKLTRLTKQLVEHQAKLAGMMQKAEAFLGEDRVSSNNWGKPTIAVREEDVEIAFLCEKQKWSGS